MMAKKTVNQLRSELTRLSMRIDQLITNYEIRLDRLKKDKDLLAELKDTINDLKDERTELREAIKEREEDVWR